MLRVQAVAIAAILAASASPAQVEQAGPRAVVDALDHDFGVYDERTPLFHVFSIWNEGDAELEVAEVKPSCGCTVPGDWERVVPPGGYWELPVSFNPSGRSGHQNQTIDVRTNDPAQPVLTFTLKGILTPRFLLNPPHHRLTFGPVHALSNKPGGVRQSVDITVNTDLPVRLGPVDVFPPIFNVCFERVVRSPTVGQDADPHDEPIRGDVYELELSSSQEMEEGVHRVSVTIPTGIPEEPEIALDIAFAIAPRLKLAPERVRLPAARSSPVRRPLVLENEGFTPVEITDISVACEGVRYEVETLAPGRKFRIWLTVPANLRPSEAGCEIRVRAQDVPPAKPRVTETRAVISVEQPRVRPAAPAIQPGG